MRHTDVSILRDLNDLKGIVHPQCPPIRTSASVAQVYTLPNENVEPSSGIIVENHGADVHDVRDTERVVLLEDLASFCTLLCAMDREGNASMLHAPLILSKNAMSESSVGILLAFRSKIETVLRGHTTVVASGMRGNWGPKIAECIHDLFTATHELVLQISGNTLRRNALPDDTHDPTYSGMLFAPPAVTGRRNGTLFLLEAHRRATLAPLLGGVSAQYKPAYATGAATA